MGKILVRYPCIICFNVKPKYGKCLRNIKVQNMFKTKLVTSNATTTPKPPKIDKVPINVIAIVTTCNQQLEQHVFKEKETIKAKGVED